MSLNKQLEFWESKYPCFYAAIAFSCGIFGPWTWGLICLPCIFIFARKNKEHLFLWCLFPFIFGIYSHQHHQFHSKSWNQIGQQEGFLKCQVKWDQDMLLKDQDLYRGWAWVIPIQESAPINSLQKRFWVEVSNTEEFQSLHVEHFLKGVKVNAWTLPTNFKEFPKLKLALDGNSFAIPWWIQLRSSLLSPLESWKDQNQHRGLAYSLLTGNRQHVQTSTLHSFDRLGLMALLALSGLHVGIVFNLFRKLPYIKHFKITASICGVFLVLLYVFLAGWPLSMFRAAAMISLFVFSLLLGRRHIGLNGLILLALWEWIRNPEVITRLDFLLSYIGVFGIMWMLKLSSPLFKTKLWFHYPIKIYLVSWGAMLWTWPIVLDFFGKLPHLGWWFAPPLFTLFGVIVLYVLFLGFLNFIRVGVSDILWVPMEWGNAIFNYLSRESSWTVPWESPPLPWVIVYYVLLCAIGLVACLCVVDKGEEGGDIAF